MPYNTFCRGHSSDFNAHPHLPPILNSTTEGDALRLWIVTQFYPPDMGAAGVRLSRLARMLVADGHEVTILTVMPNYPAGIIAEPYRGKLFCQETIDGVSVLRTWVYATPDKGARARILNQLSAMAMVALRGSFAHRPDAILVESHPLFMGIAGAWLRRIKAAPLILNVSDLWPESAVATGALHADSALVRWATRVERWLYRDAAQIVGMTEGVVAGILAVGADPRKVSLVLNGVDLERFRPNGGDGAVFRTRMNLPADQVVALHVGNMSITYDFDLILDAAERVPDVAFVFVGGGSQEGETRQKAARRGLSNVHFTGVIPHESMPDAWASGDISLIAMGDHSLAEGTRPAKLFEAMATGTPVVAAIRGEGGALVNEAGAGIVTPPRDLSAYAEAIRTLTADPARRAAMGAAGRAYAEANFPARRVKDAYLDIIRRALNEK